MSVQSKLDLSKLGNKEKETKKLTKSELNDFDDMLAEFEEIDPTVLSKPKVVAKTKNDEEIEDNLDSGEELIDEDFVKGPKKSKLDPI